MSESDKQSENKVNEQVTDESHKPVTKKFKTRKVYARFCNEMESLSFKNKNVKCLCVMDVFTNICLG